MGNRGAPYGRSGWTLRVAGAGSTSPARRPPPCRSCGPNGHRSGRYGYGRPGWTLRARGPHLRTDRRLAVAV
eukprot:929515-Prorocentrum_minimum.AAC.1